MSSTRRSFLRASVSAGTGIATSGLLKASARVTVPADGGVIHAPASESMTTTPESVPHSKSVNGRSVGRPALRAEEVVAKVIRVMQERGLHKDPSFGEYFSGYGENLFTVEAFFDCVALFHLRDVTLGKTALKIFLSLQQDNGFIPRHWNGPHAAPALLGQVPTFTSSGAQTLSQNPWAIYEREEHAQPFLFQIALFLSRASGGDVTWLDDGMYFRLKKYLQQWTADWDRDSIGLCEWASAPHSMGDTQFDRAGVWRSFYCEGADLNSFLYLEFLAAEKLATAKGFRDDAAYFAVQAKLKHDLVQTLLWDERDGFFYDRDNRTGLPIRVKSVNGLYPLWVGIPNEQQARRLVDEHIMNGKEFWSSYPLSSYARTERNYTQHHVPCPQIDIYYALPAGHSNWSGGLWPHGNYLVTHGLQRYGFTKEAQTLAMKTYEVAAADPDIHEWYDAETGKPLGAHPLPAGAEVLMRFLPTELETDFNLAVIKDAHEPLDDSKLWKALDISENFLKG